MMKDYLSRCYLNTLDIIEKANNIQLEYYVAAFGSDIYWLKIAVYFAIL